MKITDVRVGWHELGLSRPYRIAYKSVDTVAHVSVTLQTDTGVVAVGTANPSAAVVGETVQDCHARLSQTDLGFLIGAPVAHLGRLVREVHQRFADSPGARAALDIALHDLFGHLVGAPLVDVLGRCHPALPTSITIGIKSEAETLEEAEEYLGRGFRHLKVKLGAGREADEARLQALHARLAGRACLRVDINQAYAANELVAFVRRTATLGLELVEQPLRAEPGDLGAYRALPEAVRRAVILDESVVGPRDALAASQPPAPAAGFNIKLMKCGGIAPALAMANIADHAGLDLMWGCNDESVISIAAALHAALACPATRYLDLDGSLDLASDLARGGFVLEDGLMRPVEGAAGLGLEPLAG